MIEKSNCGHPLHCLHGPGTCSCPRHLPHGLQSVERPAVVKTVADDDEALEWGKVAAKLDEALGRPTPPPVVIDDDDDGAGGLIWGRISAALDEALRPPLSAAEIRERELEERFARERYHERQLEERKRRAWLRAQQTGDVYESFNY